MERSEAVPSRTIAKADTCRAADAVQYAEKAAAAMRAYLATGDSAYAATAEWFSRHAHEKAAKISGAMAR